MTDEEYEIRAVEFVETSDRTDLFIALGIVGIVGCLLTVFPHSSLHPEFWDAASVAARTRPPESPVVGLWAYVASHVCSLFGLSHGLSVLSVLGRVTGAVLSGVAYLLVRGMFSARIALPPAELVRCSMSMRVSAAVGTLLFACADPVWRQMQFFSSSMLHLLLAAVSLGAFMAFRRGGRLAWLCLSYALVGVLAAESPVGALFAAAYFTVTVAEKYQRRYSRVIMQAQGKSDRRLMRSLREMRGTAKYANAVGADADGAEELFDEDVAREADRSATSLENWTFCVFFFSGLLATAFLDSWTFRTLGGMVVRNAGAWDYPVVLFSSWLGQVREVITLDDLLAASAFSVVPCVIVYLLLPLATDPNGKLAFATGWLLTFLGFGAWTQLGPFPRLWYWSWDISRSAVPSGLVQIVFAFFAASALVGALQVICCSCRSRKLGIDTIAVADSRPQVVLRVLGRFVLFGMMGLAVTASTTGCRQPQVRQCVRLLWDYIHLTVDQVKGLRWVFTDGTFDDAVALAREMRHEELPQTVSVMSGHQTYETFLRMRAGRDAEDLPMLEASGAEALRFWVAEKPDHLKASGVQVGFESLKKCRSVRPRPAGISMRVAASAEDETIFDAYDGATVDFSRRVLAVATEMGKTVYAADRLVGEKLDCMLWRLARLADQRVVASIRRNDLAGAEPHRALAKQLDDANRSYRILSAKLERLKASEGIVLTPREGLEVSLKRADFELARQYAQMVRRRDPMDVNANFALGMWSLENQAYQRAVEYLEFVRLKRPREGVVLNNLALAYLKADNTKMAMELICEAKAVSPDSEEVKRNWREISEQFGKATASDGTSAQETAHGHDR